MISSQNVDLRVSVALAAGRKAYCMGLNIGSNFFWYSSEEHDAFTAGWLAAKDDSSEQRHANKSSSPGNLSIMN
jgi:hypothetical protein